MEICWKRRIKSTNRAGAMEGKLYREAGTKGVLGRRECKIPEKRAKRANPPVVNDTAGCRVDQPFERVA